MVMSKLILMRHGESKWNKLNLFTGWVDVPLSERGIEESFEGGKIIRDIPIDIIFTSSLTRALMTALLAMSMHSSNKVPVLQHPGQGKLEEWSKIFRSESEKECIPMFAAWELNERMYGELQGLNKAETIAKYGVEQVQIWRRSFDVAPPGGESLAMTAARTLPYFREKIVPQLVEGKNVFVAAHGNSLRSIIMQIDGLSKEEVVRLELATGLPICYDYDNEQFKRFKSGNGE